MYLTIKVVSSYTSGVKQIDQSVMLCAIEMLDSFCCGMCYAH